MSWRVETVESPDSLLDLQRRVFAEEWTAEDLGGDSDVAGLYALAVRSGDGEAVGFALLRGAAEDDQVELLRFGVLAEQRRRGAGAALLAAVERQMAEAGYGALRVSTYNRWPIMLSMLARRGYRVLGTAYDEAREDLEIRLRKPLRPRRELRFALTEGCNFDCLFCHNEGLGPARRDKAPVERVLDVLAAAVERGFTDLTLTGGEPLLERKRLRALVAGLGALPAAPDLTLVTNGYKLDAEAIEWLRDYPGETKLHLSLHATEPEMFARVTRADPAAFARVCDNVRAAAAAGLTVKVNFVVLRDINHHRVVEAVELVRGMGAQAIKFLELLVLPESADDYRMYLDIDSLHRDLAAIGLGPEREGPRRQVYRHHQDTRFRMELQRCTCHIGCSHCREVRDRTFGPDCAYHPCFVRDSRTFPVAGGGELDRTLADGDRIIDGYAARFGKRSPTLIQQEEMVPSRQELFLRVAEPERLRQFLRRRKLQHHRTVAFHEEYHRPRLRSPAWDRFERVLKVGWDLPTPDRVELVYTDHGYQQRQGLGLLTSTRFLFESGPMVLESAGRARVLLDRLDFERLMTLDWSLETWRRRHLQLNLATAAGRHTLKLSGDEDAIRDGLELLQGYDGDIEALGEPLAAFMLAAVC